jgi:hypothetical protein
MEAILPAWVVPVGVILSLVVPSVLTWYAKQRKVIKDELLKVNTAPASPDDIADIDRIQRLQDERNVPPAK